MFLAGAIFILTLVLVIWQPKGLSIGWSAVIGAALALLLVSVCCWQVVQVGGVICCGGGVPAGSSTGPGRH